MKYRIRKNEEQYDRQQSRLDAFKASFAIDLDPPAQEYLTSPLVTVNIEKTNEILHETQSFEFQPIETLELFQDMPEAIAAQYSQVEVALLDDYPCVVAESMTVVDVADCTQFVDVYVQQDLVDPDLLVNIRRLGNKGGTRVYEIMNNSVIRPLLSANRVSDLPVTNVFVARTFSDVSRHIRGKLFSSVFIPYDPLKTWFPIHFVERYLLGSEWNCAYHLLRRSREQRSTSTCPGPPHKKHRHMPC